MYNTLASVTVHRFDMARAEPSEQQASFLTTETEGKNHMRSHERGQIRKAKAPLEVHQCRLKQLFEGWKKNSTF